LTRRTLQNAAFQTVAWGALASDPHPERFKWLLDLERIRAGGPERGNTRTWRMGILIELGRFVDEDYIRAYAEQVCELEPKPTTREAVELLRICRGSLRAQQREGA
jgi:hypothetical protein